MSKTNGVSFVTFFPNCENIHLTKDVGLIPYVLQRDFGYDSYVLCYRNGEYPYTETEVKGLKLLFIDHKLHHPKTTDRPHDNFAASTSLNILHTLIDATGVFWRWRNKIDVLQLYHMKPESIFVGLIYRLINPQGVLYLKLDLDPGVIELYKKHPEKFRGKSSLRYILFKLASFDIISAESKELFEFLTHEHPFFKNFKENICYMPNGLDIRRVSPIVYNPDAKEQIILHVGRLGLYQKGSDIILEAFAEVCEDHPDWKLVLVGPIEKIFAQRLHDFSAKSCIEGRISYEGFIESRDVFYDYYKKSKIIALPSRFESFGIVGIEGGFFGDVIIGSDIPSYRDMTDGGKLGCLCPVDDVNCFAKALRHLLSHEEDLRVKSQSMSEFIRSNFDWNKICQQLNDQILQAKFRREKSQP